ncbi:MAG TPA: hypothetical protein VLL07_01320, partial [Pontiella sp.]|nr:hypothetical protein [Pontiella sp.]
MNIRVKLTLLPIIAILLPLLGGIYYVQSAARTFYERQVGLLYLTIAKGMEDALERNVIGQKANLERWIDLVGIARQLETLDASPVDPGFIAETEA